MGDLESNTAAKKRHVSHGSDDLGEWKKAEIIASTDSSTTESLHTHHAAVEMSSWTWTVFWLWLLVGAGITVYNKWLFSHHLKFPILVTLSHNVVGFVLRIFIMVVPQKYVSKTESLLGITLDLSLRKHLRRYLFLAFFTTASIALNNFALMLIHITTSQIVKAFTPIIQVYLSRCVEKTVYAWSIHGAIFLTIVGAVLSVLAVPELNALGLILSFLSAVTLALQNSFSALILSNDKVDAMSAWINLSFFSVPMLLPFFFIIEADEFYEHANEAMDNGFPLWITLGILQALILQILNFVLIQLTSSVYISVSGLLRLVILIIISLVLDPIAFDPFHITGIVIVVIGFFLFNYLLLRQDQTKTVSVKDATDSGTSFASSRSSVTKGT